MKTEPTSVLVLGKFAKILDYLTDHTAAASVSAMSRTLAIPRATLYRLLESLVEQDIIVQRRDRYEIGPRMLSWAARALNTSSVRQVAFPYMQALREEFGLSVSLYIRGRDSRICIERIEGGGPLQPVLRIGEQLPLHLCASGTALMAWLPVEQRNQFLEASRQRFVGAPIIERTDEWWSEIRKQGWVMTIGERDPELAGLATPIFDESGAPIAALLISGLQREFSSPDFNAEGVGQRLLETVRQIHEVTGRRLVA
jgi:DNA-binding IclR family transcriptional regulator